MNVTYTSFIAAMMFFVGFMLILVIFYLRAKAANQRRIDNEKLRNELAQVAFDNLISRPQEPDLTSNTSFIDVPYTICYFNTPSDPTRWINTIDSPSAYSPIVRRTRAVPVPGDRCPPESSDTIQFDLRKDAATINDGFNKNADEILVLFLDLLYSIRIERETILKNLTYAPDTGIFRVSVMAVYRKPNGSFSALMNRFIVSPEGTIVNNPVQALDRMDGSFTQINQKGTTLVRNAITRVLCICARSTATNTLTVFLRQSVGSSQPKVIEWSVLGITFRTPTGEIVTTMEYTDALTTLSLDNTRSLYDWLILPDPTVASTLFFVVQGTGSVQIETLTQYSISATGVPTLTNYLSTTPSLARLQPTPVTTVTLV